MIDKTMPYIEAMLEPSSMQKRLSEVLDRELELLDLKLLRHKKGKRCLIQYDLKDKVGNKLSILAKARAKGLDQRSYITQKHLGQQGFEATSPDNISVPEVLGTLPEFHVFLQEKVPGENLGALLAKPDSQEYMTKVAAALAKLHSSAVETGRSHTLDDELEILEDRLEKASELLPAYKTRIGNVMLGCEVLANRLSVLPPHTLHRDFYQDQILISDKRLYLLDFDLMALGNPALDVGNFLAHLTEYAIRLGNSERFAVHEGQFETSYRAKSSLDLKESIQAFKTLSLARHIFISTQFSERQAFTTTILELCEKRLAPYQLKRSSPPRYYSQLTHSRLL